VFRTAVAIVDARLAPVRAIESVALACGATSPPVVVCVSSSGTRSLWSIKAGQRSVLPAMGGWEVIPVAMGLVVFTLDALLLLVSSSVCPVRVHCTDFVLRRRRTTPLCTCARSSPPAMMCFQTTIGYTTISMVFVGDICLPGPLPANLG